jgi:hypothetical protein
MGNNCPLHTAQPFGAKLKLKILISERNGSGMGISPKLDFLLGFASVCCQLDVYVGDGKMPKREMM